MEREWKENGKHWKALHVESTVNLSRLSCMNFQGAGVGRDHWTDQP